MSGYNNYGYQDDQSRRPGAGWPQNHLGTSTHSAYSQPSSYGGAIDSYYSNTSTNVQRAPSPQDWSRPSPGRAASDTYNAQPTYAAPMSPAQQVQQAYRVPSPSYNTAPSAYRAPSPQFDPSYHPQQPSMQPRPSFSSHRSDFPDETKSYTSTTHLASKEYDVGSIIPTVPAIPNQYSGYPPSAPYSASPYGQPIPSPAPTNHGGTSHWHAMRKQLMERRVVKQIPLSNGNLIMDVAVPKGVVPTAAGLGAEKEEITKMRYSAATCDPDDFMRRKFTLRPYLYGRRTELFIVMTMYNEGSDLLLRTLNSVIKNIAHLCSRNRSKTWGPDAWKKVVVCIVADGRKVIDARVLKVLQLMGIYAEGVMKDTVAGKETQAHIFEYTSQIVVSDTGEVGFGSVPVQFVFCLKEQNKKKLNSHRWFFNAFGPLLKPNVCVLLDVGTKPSGTSIYELYKVFEKQENVGGACGEIYADTGSWGKYLWNPLVAGQNFEYKMSNILDKPFESVFGLISVLPGAFSAYRYAAVANHADGTGPLASYFHGEMMNLPGASASIFDRNKFLAEDRILAFEIVTKKNAKWRLQYVKSAKAGTDVPATVPEFISQRRRWLNGSYFASLYSLVCFWKIWTSGHNFFRKICLMVLMVYNLISTIFSTLSLSSFYLAFYFLIDSSIKGTRDPFGGAGDEIFQVFNKVYIALIFIVIVCSLGNRPQGSNWMYTICILMFAICQGLLLYCAGWTVYETVPHTAEGWTDVQGLFNNQTFFDLALSLMATYGLYLLSSLLYFEPWHMLTSFVQYLLLLPSYVNILLIYAFCNLHDVSWGTKGDNGASKDLGAAKKVDKDGQEMAEVALPTKEEDVEALWQQARQELRVPVEEKKEKRSAETKRSDEDKVFRTNVVLLFLGINMVVILLFTSSVFTNWISTHFSEATSTTFNPYLRNSAHRTRFVLSPPPYSPSRPVYTSTPHRPSFSPTHIVSQIRSTQSVRAPRSRSSSEALSRRNNTPCSQIRSLERTDLSDSSPDQLLLDNDNCLDPDIFGPAPQVHPERTSPTRERTRQSPTPHLSRSPSSSSLSSAPPSPLAADHRSSDPSTKSARENFGKQASRGAVEPRRRSTRISTVYEPSRRLTRLSSARGQIPPVSPPIRAAVRRRRKANKRPPRDSPIPGQSASPGELEEDQRVVAPHVAAHDISSTSLSPSDPTPSLASAPVDSCFGKFHTTHADKSVDTDARHSSTSIQSRSPASPTESRPAKVAFDTSRASPCPLISAYPPRFLADSNQASPFHGLVVDSPSQPPHEEIPPPLPDPPILGNSKPIDSWASDFAASPALPCGLSASDSDNGLVEQEDVDTLIASFFSCPLTSPPPLTSDPPELDPTTPRQTSARRTFETSFTSTATRPAFPASDTPVRSSHHIEAPSLSFSLDTGCEHFTISPSILRPSVSPVIPFSAWVTMSDSDSDLSSAPASPRQSPATRAAPSAPTVEAGPSSAASPSADPETQSKAQSPAFRPAAPTRVPSGRTRRARQVYSPSEGSSSRRSSIVPPSKPTSSAPTPVAGQAPTPPLLSASTPSGPNAAPTPAGESLTPPPLGSQHDESEAKGSGANSAKPTKPATADAKPRGKKRKSDDAALAAEQPPAPDVATPVVPKLKLKLGGASKASRTTDGQSSDIKATPTEKKAKKTKKDEGHDADDAEASTAAQTTSTAEPTEVKVGAGTGAPVAGPEHTGSKKGSSKAPVHSKEAGGPNREVKRPVAKKKKKMVIDSDDDEDGDGNRTPATEDDPTAREPAAEVATSISGGVKATKSKNPAARGDGRGVKAEDVVKAGADEQDDKAEAGGTSVGDQGDKPAKVKKAARRNTTENAKDEPGEQKADADNAAEASVPESSKEKEVKHDTPVRSTKAVGAAAKPTPDPKDLAFRKKKPVPKPAGAKLTPGAKASPAPATGPASTLLSQTLAALTNKGTPSKPATKQDKKDVPTPGTADWRAEYVLSQQARTAYDASAPERAKEKAERARWKLNAVNLQESKDIYKADSDPEKLHERQIHLADGSQIGIKTKAADVIKALWAKQDRSKAAGVA